MKIFSTLFCFLLALIAMPVLLDGSTAASLDALTESELRLRDDSAAKDATSAARESQVTTNPHNPTATRNSRSRRPARIDLTMPYYRFGRAPTRIKD